MNLQEIKGKYFVFYKQYLRFFLLYILAEVLVYVRGHNLDHNWLMSVLQSLSSHKEYEIMYIKL